MKKNINEIKMEKNFSETVETGFILSENDINDLKLYIETKDEKKLENAILRIPLRSMEYSITTKLLLVLLDHLELYGFKEGLKIILRQWSGMETGFDEYEGEIYPVIPTLFLDPYVPFRNLYYIMETLSDVISVLEVALILFEKGVGDQLNTALRNLFDMVGEPSGELFRTLYEEAYNSQNQTAIDFMGELQTYYTLPAKKPNYIFNINGDEEGQGDELPEESDLIDVANDILEDEIAVPTCANVEQCVNYLTQGLTKFGIEVVDLDQTKKVLRDKLNSMTKQDRQKYIQTFVNQDMMEKMYENEILFQILGPCNPLVNGDFTQKTHVCFKYGGCRMLFCNCFEVEMLSQQGETDSTAYYPNIPQWFTGKCEHCKRLITKRCYSVRRPLPQGGWRGTFCSWNCVHLSGHMDDELSYTYADMTEQRMKSSLITDRIEPNTEELLIQAKEEDPEGYHFHPIVL